MNFAEEFRNLDKSNPGNWPWPFKIGALALMFVLIIGLAVFFIFKDQQEAFEQEQAKVEQKKTIFVEKAKLAVNLEAYQTQRADIEQAFGTLLKKLPTKSEMDALIIDINQAGLGRGLTFELFQPATAEKLTEFYAELPISLAVTGNYHDLGAFASDVSRLPRIVTLTDFVILSAKDGGKDQGLLKMTAQAKTYRYLDPEEINKQRKVSKDAKAAAAPAAPAKGGK
jgi:type IV pilus assembly protein PilO